MPSHVFDTNPLSGSLPKEGLLESQDPRHKLAQIITTDLKHVSSIAPEDRYLFYKYFVKAPLTYGNSFTYICQACNGIGSSGFGLKYHDGESIAGVGVFKRSDGSIHCHIVNPVGFTPDKLKELADAIYKATGQVVYIKKIHKEMKDLLLESGFQDISKHPWYPTAPAEDDTYPEITIEAKPLISACEGHIPGDQIANSKLVTKTYARITSEIAKELENKRNPDSVRFREVSRELREIAEQRSLRQGRTPFGRVPGAYQSFIRRNSVNNQTIDISTDEHKTLAREVIDGYFRHLEENRAGQFSSRAEDYYVTLACADRNCVRQLILIQHGDVSYRRPVGYLAMEPIFSTEYTESNRTLGIYANLTNRSISHLSEYVILEACKFAANHGYRYVALGGSEMPDLVKWKRSLAGSLVPEKQMFWATYSK